MTIEVIEIRRAANGYVISCIEQPEARYRESCHVRGFRTYICGDSPAEVAATIEKAITEQPITSECAIPPARQLP